MPEGLSASEVGRGIAEHREHAAAEHAPAEHAQRDRWVAIFKAVLVKLFRLDVNRLRAGYRPAFEAWIALRPLKNPHAPPDPSYMPQYRIPQQAVGLALSAQTDTHFNEGQSAAGTADEYVRLTVFLAAVLFLVGICSRFPVRAARYGLVGVPAMLLAISSATPQPSRTRDSRPAALEP